jgi:hypothetical protein
MRPSHLCGPGADNRQTLESAVNNFEGYGKEDTFGARYLTKPNEPLETLDTFDTLDFRVGLVAIPGQELEWINSIGTVRMDKDVHMLNIINGLLTTTERTSAGLLTTSSTSSAYEPRRTSAGHSYMRTTLKDMIPHDFFDELKGGGGGLDPQKNMHDSNIYGRMLGSFMKRAHATETITERLSEQSSIFRSKEGRKEEQQERKEGGKKVGYQGWKDGRMEGWKEGRTEGRKTIKKGRKEGGALRKEGRKTCLASFPSSGLLPSFLDMPCFFPSFPNQRRDFDLHGAPLGSLLQPDSARHPPRLCHHH